MFDIGFLEIAIILVLSLLVLGPERLPKAARTVGYWFGKARRYVEGMKTQVEAEFDSSEVKRLLHNQEVQIRELQNKVQNGEDYINSDYHNQFEDKDDPGTDHAELEERVDGATHMAAEKKAASPQYDMIEEDDEEWGSLEDSNSVKPSESVEKIADDKKDKNPSLDKTQ